MVASLWIIQKNTANGNVSKEESRSYHQHRSPEPSNGLSQEAAETSLYFPA
jgi:hypothetical protein